MRSIIFTFMFSLFATISLFLSSCGKSEIKYANRGSISGTIRDGLSGNEIIGVDVTENIDNSSTTSDGSGNFSFSELLPGPRTFTFSHESYDDQSRVLSIQSDITSNYNVSLLNSGLSTNVITVILTWGEVPQDLDTYLYAPTGPSTTTQISHSSRGDADRADPPHAYLDRDDTNQYGPETLTIRFLSGATDYDRTYRYFVRKFSSSGDFKDSGAVVRVYKNGIFIKEWNASTTATEAYWLVFDMASDGTLTSQDIYSNSMPSKLY